jgi:hypothetical protein
MKLLILLGLLCIFSSLANTGVASEIFWDRDKGPNASISEKDFRFQYGSPKARSLGDQEIYDSEKTERFQGPIMSKSDEEELPTPAPTPEVRAEPAQPIVPQNLTPLKRERAQRTPPAPARNRETLFQQKEPAPEKTTPVVPQSTEITTPSVPGKMKWGQSEVKSEEAKTEEKSEKNKLHWGR